MRGKFYQSRTTRVFDDRDGPRRAIRNGAAHLMASGGFDNDA